MKRTCLKVLALAALLAGAGCEEDFSPLSPTALQYSVFGYLDAAADTQWVRVMPIRERLVTTPDPAGTVVTLEHVASGRVIALRDSLFRYNDPGNVSEGVYLHNYWTTERIEAGASYRLAVREPGRDPAEAVVRVPPRYATEVWLRQSTAPGSAVDRLQVIGAEHVPFATVTTSFYDNCGWFSETSWLTVPAGADGTHAIPLVRPTVPPRTPACGPARPDSRSVWVVGSADEWPQGEQYAPANIGEWQHVSNVTNSLGFFGGVLTRRVPFETCELLGPAPLPHHCKLRYDESTATIQGLVKEVRCGRGSFDTMQIQLRQITPDAAGYRKVRTVLANRANRYQVGGLEPGVPYLLVARVPTRAGQMGPEQLYRPHSDTVVFAPGEQRQHDLPLWRLDDCNLPYR